MDQDGRSSIGRKVKFTPKPPPRRKLRSTVTKIEAEDDDAEDAANRALLRRFNENLGKKGPRVENPFSMQMGIGPGVSPSTTTKSFDIIRDQNSGKMSASELKDDNPDGVPISTLPIVKADENNELSADSTNPSSPKIKKEYIDPWDYEKSNYPTVLPLRKPYSGDPEILDEVEFGKAKDLQYDENTINPASELGLLEESEREQMFLFKLPANMPLVKQSASRKGKEKVGSSSSTESIDHSKKSSDMADMSGGYMGKMLVYKSGAVKLKLGDILYDVSPGSECDFAQDVVAINTKEKDFCILGQIGKHVVVEPDIDSLLLDDRVTKDSK